MPLTPLWNVPNPPPNFLPRLEDLEALKAKLLNVQRSVVMTGSSAGVTVQGMGGLGKSVLAASVAHDAEVQRAFPNGVFWLTVGQEAKLLELQTELAKAVLGDSTDRQPDFSTVPQGQTYLRSLLADKACLLVLDDIWQVTALAALNCIGARGQLLVTTRDARITTSIGATEYQLELLSNPQARRLLAQWTQIPETVLPPEADAVVAECGALPLALAMTGAMLRGKPDRWSNVLHKLRSADLEKIKQQFPDYPYPDLLKAIAISVDALDPDLRQRYLDFALFPEDTPIPEAVLQTFWEPEGLDKYDTQDAIDELANLSLLRRDDQGRVTLHDLQVDFVRKQVGAGLPQLHERWLAAYRELCPQGWHELVNDGYCFEGLAYHLVGAGCEEKLRSLLLDFRWLQARLRETTVNGLLSDYEGLPEEITLKLVRNSLRLSAHVLAIEKGQLAGRLLGHLLGRKAREIQALLTQAEQQQSVPWLRPLQATLTPPDGALLRTLEGHSHIVSSVAVLPDGKRALSASNDCTLKLWNIDQGLLLRTLEGHSQNVNSVAVLPDGKCALSASSDHTLKLWDLEQEEVLKTLEGHSGSVTSVAVLPDGNRALSASSDCTLKLWDLEQGILLKTLEGHSEQVNSVAVMSDGKRALSASFDGIIKLWNIEQGILLKTLEGHSKSVNCLAVLPAPDSNYAISASGDIIKFWDIEQGVVLQTFRGHSKTVRSVAVLPSGKRVLSGSSDGTIKLWDIAQGIVLQSLEKPRSYIWSVAVLPDGDRALSGSSDGTLKLWDIKQSGTLQPSEEHSERVNSVAVLPDSKRALSGSSDGTIKLWDIEQGVVLQTLEKQTPSIITAVVMVPNSDHALFASLDGIVKFWDIKQGVVLKVLKQHRPSISAMAVLPSGNRILSASHDGIMSIWDIEQGVVLKSLEGHSNVIDSVAVLPDGNRVLSSSSDNTIKLWDLNQGKILHTLEGHSERVSSVVVMPDGKRALSASHDATLKLWDIERGVLLQTLKSHHNGINSVVVMPDGKRALSASLDCTLKLWELSTGQSIATLVGDSPFTCCAVAPDRVTIIAGNTAGKVHFFSIES